VTIRTIEMLADIEKITIFQAVTNSSHTIAGKAFLNVSRN
jgi:hypothetical protein